MRNHIVFLQSQKSSHVGSKYQTLAATKPNRRKSRNAPYEVKMDLSGQGARRMNTEELLGVFPKSGRGWKPC